MRSGRINKCKIITAVTPLLLLWVYDWFYSSDSSLDSSRAESNESSTFFFFFLAGALISSISIS